jgi:UDP-GlcNAc:undecaprenyl-phosphate/decaprenyl-phosphate GlcNAc-1-phosphate transferase
MLMISFVVALISCMVITPWVIRVADAKQLYDLPIDSRRVHTTPIPRLGGTAVFGSTLFGLGAVSLYLAHLGNLPAGTGWFFGSVLIGGGALFAVGLVDDLRGVSPYVKLGAQITVGIVAWAMGIRIDTMSFGAESAITLGIASLPLTVAWIVLVTNAFNLIDGLDGLATGMGIVALGSMVGMAALLGRAEVLVVALAMLGALLAFLRFNFRPARIFLGDSGSLFIGYSVAILSVHGSTKSGIAMLGVAPLLALALPLLDTTLAVLRRWLRGHSFSVADRRHIHHQLLARGHTHEAAVVMLYLVASSLAVLGFAFVFAPPAWISLIAITGGILSIALLLWGLGYLDYHEFSEAWSVMMFAPMRVKKVIRDQINARDLARMVGEVPSLERLNDVLAQHANDFGFFHLTVCRESERSSQRSEAGVDSPRGYMPKLEYPVLPTGWIAEDPYVLRIWCYPDISRPFGAERVARILAPAVEEWLMEHATHGSRPNLVVKRSFAGGKEAGVVGITRG